MPASRITGALFTTAALAGLVSALTPAAARAAVLVSSPTYQQNFDGLVVAGQKLPFGTAESDTQGWICAPNGGGTIGTYSTIERGDTDFGLTGGTLKAFACMDGTDIALGVLQGSGNGFATGVFLRNGTSAPITSVQIASTLELWRKPSPTPSPANLAGIDWAIGPGTLSETDSPVWPEIVTFTRIDGSSFRPLSTDPLYHSYTVSGSLTGLSWNPGETLILRWYFPSTFAAAGNTSPVLALDDVNLTFSGAALPEPTSALAGTAVMWLALTVRFSGQRTGSVCRRQRSRRYHR